MNFEGENISLRDALFVDNITGDLESFRVRSSCVSRVLVFPPVNNYHRFLIHKVVETGFPQFTTFSVGESVDRRTVVCFQQHLLEHTLNHSSQDGPGEQKIERSDFESEDSITVDSLKSAESKVNNVCEINPAEVRMENDDLNQSCTHMTVSKTSIEEVANFEQNNKIDNDSLMINDSNELKDMKITTDADVGDNGSSIDNSKDVDQLSLSDGTSKKIRSRRPAMAVYVPPRGRALAQRTKRNPSNEEFEKNTERNTCSRVANLTVPDGIDVTEQVVNEITVAVGGVQIEAPDIDYLAFQTSDSTINIDQFGHVIELYNFPSEYRTVDLVNAFQAFTSRWDIKWVDDTHALGVFSSSEVAAEALAVRHPIIMTRPLNMATPQSKCKARSVLDELLPYKPRPVSCTAPARRLLQWALGSEMRVPEASKLENERLNEARRQKKEGRQRDYNNDRKKRREDEQKPFVDRKIRNEHDDR